MKMNCRIVWNQVLLLGFLFAAPEGLAQDLLGLNTDNYAGVHKMQIQPASIVASPYKLDFNVLGINFLGLNSEFFSKLNFSKDLNKFRKSSFFELFKQGKKEYLLSGNFLIPSFMLQLDEKSALGVSFQVQAHLFAKGSDVDLNDLILNDFKLDEFFGKIFNDGFVTMRVNSWTELNFTYARAILRTDKHKLRVGITPKILISQAGGYFSVDNLEFELEDADYLLDLKGDLQFGYNESMRAAVAGGRFNFFENLSFGLNLGIEYELRSPQRSVPLREGYYDPGYQLKIGLSYTDIGSLKYNKLSKSANYRADLGRFPINSLRELESIDALADTLSAYFFKVETESSFRMQLPSRLRLQVDYKLEDFLYLNFSTDLATSGRDRQVFETRNLNLYALTFRYEKPKLGVHLPVSYNDVIKLNLGMGVRWGSVVLGSSNLISTLFQKDPAFNNFYFAMKLPFLLPDYRGKRRKSKVGSEE